ncbi:LOW QUALITY PROTEIN: hypothetical protein V2J09_015271 [Rumex salicifolius]
MSNLPIADDIEWRDLFINALWWIWRWRNKEVFDGQKWTGDRWTFLLETTFEYKKVKRSTNDPKRIKGESSRSDGPNPHKDGSRSIRIERL